ncbi:MAG: lipopolysaccharide heptosyltransferase II [Verrucomicrobiota bacterium]|nr:lipopolysaccharide heptosyltransferase II [Verrucomicrobiota bacterium]
MLDFGTYLLYRAGSAVVSVIPLRLLFRLGELLGLAAWIVLPRYRRLARENLGIAFGHEQTAAELRRLARRHFRRLGANLLSSVKLGTMPLEKVEACVSLENAELVHNELRAGRPLVFALSHLGSWELFAQVFSRHFGYVRNSTVYQALGNRYIDEDVRKKRARAGVELFDRKQGFQKAIELLRSGGVLGILSDQHAGDHGLWTPFFGRLASTTPLPGLLAKRTGAGVISAAIYTAGPARWRMVFTPRFDTADDSIQTITAKANDVIAAQIRSAPEDWFWVHNRWKTPKPDFLLTDYKRGIHLPPGAQLQPFRILIRGTNWLGDSVISADAVRAIKRGRPDSHVTVAAPAKIASIWKLVPEVDEVLSLPGGGSLGAVVRRFRSEPRFDVAILFPNSLRTALEVWLAGVPRRVGYAGHHRRWLLNQIVPEPAVPHPIEHQMHRYRQFARYLGTSADPEVVAPVRPARPLRRIGLCPGAEYGSAKRWLPERFAEVAASVASERPVDWILFGTTADADIGKIIADHLGDRCVNRIGQTTLDELIMELRECALLLTNDTGTMHLATLLGVPVVAVFGSTEHRLTGPLGRGNHVIRHHVECSPCFLRECPIDFRCMHAVSSEEVTAAVLTALGSDGGSVADNSVASLSHSA